MMKAAAVVLVAVLAVVTAEVAFMKKCEQVSQDACTIHELRVTPCTRNPCLLKKGRNASLEFDYTPNFSTDKLTQAVYWADDPNQVPFPTVGVVDACPYTTCPVVSGTQNTLKYSLYIGKKLPKGKFMFRWKVWNSDNEAQVCCFETQVELRA